MAGPGSGASAPWGCSSAHAVTTTTSSNISREAENPNSIKNPCIFKGFNQFFTSG